jgi:hypothetical protein
MTAAGWFILLSSSYFPCGDTTCGIWAFSAVARLLTKDDGKKRKEHDVWDDVGVLSARELTTELITSATFQSMSPISEAPVG